MAADATVYRLVSLLITILPAQGQCKQSLRTASVARPASITSNGMQSRDRGSGAARPPKGQPRLHSAARHALHTCAV